MMFTPIISNFFCQLDLHSCPLCGLWMPFGSWRRHFGQHLILSRSRFEPVSITFSHYHRISLGDIYTYMCMRVCFSACVCEKVIGLFQNILKYDEINHSIFFFFFPDVIVSGIGAIVWLVGLISWVIIFQQNRSKWGAMADYLYFIIPKGIP